MYHLFHICHQSLSVILVMPLQVITYLESVPVFTYKPSLIVISHPSLPIKVTTHSSVDYSSHSIQVITHSVAVPILPHKPLLSQPSYYSNYRSYLSLISHISTPIRVINHSSFVQGWYQDRPPCGPPWATRVFSSWLTRSWHILAFLIL